MFLVILFCLFFWIWQFLSSSCFFSLARLGEEETKNILSHGPQRKAYYSLHRILFSPSYDSFALLTKINISLASIGSFISLLLLVFELSPHTNLYFDHLLDLIVILFILALFLFSLFDAMPYIIARYNPKKLLRVSTILATPFFYISLPFTFLVVRGAGWFFKQPQSPEATDSSAALKEAISQIILHANVNNKLTTGDKKLIESVIKFKDRIVREVMVPRVDLFCLPATITIREAAEQLQREGYSRIPVFRDTIDNIIGVLMFKDILELYMECETQKRDPQILNSSIATIVKPAIYTPETKKVSYLLQELRTQQIHLAIVVDEYGGTEGVVTIEDILEAIVGEIADEYDVDEELLFFPHPSGLGWTADAHMSIIDAEQAFEIQIPQEGDYDTIGGYLFYSFGTIPKEGEKLHHEDFDIEVTQSTDRSIEKVWIKPNTAHDDQTHPQAFS